MLPPRAYARQLRREASTPERALWRALRRAFPERHWRRQVAIGPYFADFALHAAKLAIEIDGGLHADRKDEDARRTMLIETHGFHVTRFWSNDVMHNMEGVIETVRLILPQRTPTPPSPKGGGL